MKPKTKLQKKVLKLSAKLKEPSEADKEWANGILFDNYYVECRNRNNCLECGHKWNSEDAKLSKYILPTTCPNCEKSNLDHVDHWDTDESKYEYWAIIDVIEYFQVVRMFFVEKYMKRKQTAQYWHREVMQHWIREDGKITSLTKPCRSMGAYGAYDAWSSGGELEPRTNSYNHKMRCGIRPYKIRAGRETLTIIRRNGYAGYFKGTAPHLFFQAILKHSEAETLLKAGQLSLFIQCVGIDGEINEDIKKYWDSICIAIRNDYIVEDARSWFDYLGQLERFDKDLNSPHYICPEDFEAEHERYSEKIRKMRERKNAKKRRKKMLKDQANFKESKSHFFDLLFSSGEIKVIPLKSIQEFIEEGKKLHHCIGSANYYRKKNKLILSARIDGEPIETVEVDLNRLEVVQQEVCRTRLRSIMIRLSASFRIICRRSLRKLRARKSKG